MFFLAMNHILSNLLNEILFLKSFKKERCSTIEYISRARRMIECEYLLQNEEYGKTIWKFYPGKVDIIVQCTCLFDIARKIWACLLREKILNTINQPMRKAIWPYSLYRFSNSNFKLLHGVYSVLGSLFLSQRGEYNYNEFISFS